MIHSVRPKQQQEEVNRFQTNAKYELYTVHYNTKPVNRRFSLPNGISLSVMCNSVYTIKIVFQAILLYIFTTLYKFHRLFNLSFAVGQICSYAAYNDSDMPEDVFSSTHIQFKNYRWLELPPRGDSYF